MYYLGKHKGSPDDTYTQSSTIWEHFTKDNIPKGVTREILAYGTDEEMCILEHELLVKAKNGGDWDRYYNESLGDPFYGGFGSGENNPQYKHGRFAGAKGDREIYNKAMRAHYKSSPELREYQKEWAKTPKRKASKKAYQQTPKYKLWKKEYEKTPKRKAYMKAWMREYEQTPERKAYKKKYMKEYRARKKAETQGEGTLDSFISDV